MGGGVQLFSRGSGVNADLYNNLVIFWGMGWGGGLIPHIPVPLDPRMLTHDLLITSTYISDQCCVFKSKTSFHGNDERILPKELFYIRFFFYFVVFKILKTIMHQKYIEFTISSTRNPQAKLWSP